MARYSYDCPVRWSDLDAFGHVNNARFLTLYEEARAALMFLAARAEGLTTLEAGTVIARHEVDYLRPVDFGEPVRIELWLAEIRNASFRVSYELFDAGRLASRATSVLVPYDLAAGRPRRLSTAEREFLSRWTEA
ncbi:acyl-CoA thioesterase [Actinocatenispora comari]|jgi:acyl-CoA thioester hydrolase|uniref:Thioesterase n=1 Tax=Actinocatenispora comari TaxID=2807577 RepID=A0A8J4ENF5_9ACTN|nr:thioesterase family protein [Actinocatenispora comari]GIL27639.1 thioesterase [Actinocatenispora comari]